ncbi:WhiB family transcriptional regulator [uncultured Friedmanniella sp.]|uniref:WhiB family transcriptional regulator n=1 Tax=uncultured Friedmanniella sp. TaxID=335381 RepID=UPI0035CC14CB
MTVSSGSSGWTAAAVLSGNPGPDVLSPDLPCRLVDPEVFFAEAPADVEAAKALCTDCPLRASCLSGALERREPWGVWGGELFIAGVVVARKRPRGRPRKQPVGAAAEVTRREAAA